MCIRLDDNCSASLRENVYVGVNIRGPRIDPCGTPKLQLRVEDNAEVDPSKDQEFCNSGFGKFLNRILTFVSHLSTRTTDDGELGLHPSNLKSLHTFVLAPFIKSHLEVRGTFIE